MEYKKIENDFVKRTLQLINSYKGEYEVTLLINCCLGLLILPKERHYAKIPSKTIPESGAIWGITRNSLVVDCPNCGYNLIEVLRHLRNGICHFKIDAEPNNSGEIAKIVIKDRGMFKAIFSPSQLRELATSFGEHVLKHNEELSPN